MNEIKWGGRSVFAVNGVVAIEIDPLIPVCALQCLNLLLSRETCPFILLLCQQTNPGVQKSIRLRCGEQALSEFSVKRKKREERTGLPQS